MRDFTSALADPGKILERLSNPIRRGGKWVACCPLHSEKTASFHVTQRSGVWGWKCFGCGRSGNAINLVRELDGVGFHEACDRLGVPKTDTTDRRGETEDEARLRMLDTMPPPLSPWDAKDPVLLFCGCSTTWLNRPTMTGPFRRERIPCAACDKREADELDAIGPKSKFGIPFFAPVKPTAEELALPCACKPHVKCCYHEHWAPRWDCQ